MPADIVTMRDCASNYGIFDVKSDSTDEVYIVTFDGEAGAHCTCKAWLYSADNDCKHVNRTYLKACMYNPQYCDGHENPIKPRGFAYTQGLDSNEPCPNCGGPTVLVRRAV